MRRLSLSATILAAALSMLVNACGRDKAAAHRDSAGGSPVTDTMQSAAPAQAASAVVGPIPAAVTQVGTFAEDAYDAAHDAKWADAAKLVDSLAKAAPALPGTGSSKAEFLSLVDSLKTAVARRNRAKALHLSNRLTYLSAGMSAPYQSSVPTDVLLMDYWGRELEILAAERDIAGLNRVVGEIAAGWQRLRPAVAAHNGAAETTRFDALVERVKSAKSPPEFEKLAKPFLDEVDKLELVFTKQ